LFLITAYLFAAGYLTPVTQTIAWFSIFFFASAAASSAYLIATEISRSRPAPWRSRASTHSAPPSAKAPRRSCSAG
jgi:hypothetical protein